MIQESRFLIEMADTVQEKIVQCQKAGNLPPLPPFRLETIMMIFGRLLKFNYTLSYTEAFV